MRSLLPERIWRVNLCAKWTQFALNNVPYRARSTIIFLLDQPVRAEKILEFQGDFAIVREHSDKDIFALQCVRNDAKPEIFPSRGTNPNR